MTRYFMTIPEASQLVLQAGSMGKGGEIFILDMGEPVRIVDLARDLIRLSGFSPDDEIGIEFTGIRPGEKLFEELSIIGENADTTQHPKIFVGRTTSGHVETVRRWMAELASAVGRAEDVSIRDRLAKIVPEYAPADDVGSRAHVQAPATAGVDHGFVREPSEATS
jgi:FlaA1/EpsC-like NDP-sugar epimerase